MKTAIRTIINGILPLMVMVIVGSCSLEKGYELRFSDDDLYVIICNDTTTFDRLDNKRLIIYKSFENADWVLEKREDGLFYPIYKCNNIRPIAHTVDYVVAYDSINEWNAVNPWVYRLRDGRKLTCCNDTLLYGYRFVGYNDTLAVFRTGLDLWDSRGRRARLKNIDTEVTIDESGRMMLTDGGVGLITTTDEFFQWKPTVDTTQTRVIIRYTDPSVSEDCYVDADIEYPDGKTEADGVVRQWMSRLLHDEIYSYLEGGGIKEKPVIADNPNLWDVLDRYVIDFQQQYKRKYGIWTNSLWNVPERQTRINIQRVMDTKRWVTYAFDGEVNDVQRHPHGFFITYDKEKKRFLDYKTIVRPDEFQKMLTLTKGRFYEMRLLRTGSWNGLEGYENWGVDENVCASWNGINRKAGDGKDALTLLQHMAVMPQGIVVSVHSGQFGNDIEGDYHVLIPYRKLKGLLQFDIEEKQLPQRGLSYFLNIVA